jgi:hypothetical protein
MGTTVVAFTDIQRKAWAAIKEWLVFLPILGSALAVTYDLGFFYGLDITYYTIFSLSEHIVFAFQFIPVAFLGVIIACAIAIVFVRGAYSISSEGFLKFERTLKNLLYFLAAVTLCTMIVSFLIGAYFFGAQSLFMAIIVVILLVRRQMTVPTAILLVLTMEASSIFCVGAQEAGFAKQDSEVHDTITLTDGATNLRGRLIRSGDRGVLFLDVDAKHLSLVPWRDIKRIESVE